MSSSSNKVTSINFEDRNIHEVSEVIPELASYSNLRHLVLKKNKISFLGNEIGRLVKLQSLDITKNPIESARDIAEGISSLKKLVELKVDLGRDEIGMIHAEFPNIKKINNTVFEDSVENSESRYLKKSTPSLLPSKKSRRRNKVPGVNNEFAPPEDNPKYSIETPDLEKVAALFDCIKLLFIEENPSLKNDLSQNLADHIKKIMVDLKLTITPTMHPSIEAAHNLKARFALYEIIFGKIIEFIKDIGLEQIGEILDDLHDSHSSIFGGFLEIIFNLEPQTKELYENFREKNRNAYEEAGLAMKGAEKLYEENQQIVRNLKSDHKKWDLEKDNLLLEISNLENENKRYLEMILKHSKNTVGEITKNSLYNNNTSMNKSEAESNGEPSKIKRSQIRIPTTSSRILTLKQLKEVIEEIYQSKLKCDEKYLKAKLPRETLEQHMYTYLNTKYGLKSLVIEWAQTIINGIKNFNSVDNDVAVFGKILRNECDEEFRFVQTQVKATIIELLKMLLKTKYPNKNSIKEMKNLVDSKTNGYLSKEEAEEIVKYMYSEEDSHVILTQLKKHLAKTDKKIRKDKIKREEKVQILKERSKKKISFTKFEKLILDFQLKSHERFLRKFNDIFKSCDGDQNGIIDDKEFSAIVNVLDPRGRYGFVLIEMLDLLDPFSSNIITYSSCVTLFSGKLVLHGDKEISILHKLSLED